MPKLLEKIKTVLKLTFFFIFLQETEVNNNLSTGMEACNIETSTKIATNGDEYTHCNVIEGTPRVFGSGLY